MRSFIILLSLSTFCIGEVITVDTKGDGDFVDIQSALDAATDGDMVIVEPGEYEISEMLNFNRLRHLMNPDDLRIKNITLKSRNGPYDTVVRMKDRKYSVIGFLFGENEESILDGFTLTGGSGRAMYYDSDNSLCSYNLGGGGIFIQHSSPTIRNCIISGNYCRNERGIGAGILTTGASPTITNCIITKNATALTTPSGFGPSGLGGGFASSGSNSRPVYANCMIINNEAPGQGWGAAGYVRWESEVTMNNCLIADNISNYGPGGILCEHFCVLNLHNCTIAGNMQFIDGVYGYAGISLMNHSKANIINSIIWGNRNKSLGASADSTINARYSCIDYYGVWPGEGNTHENPFFVNPEAGDYRLRPDSPMINAGIIEGELDAEVDIEGNPRWCWDGIDMGAYEYCREVEPGPLTQFKRGDVNVDAQTNIADAISLLEFLFVQKTEMPCLTALDANDDGKINLADPVVILCYAYADAGRLPPPFFSCGEDPTWDGISCREFALCK